jgi:protein O-mannosyl-transferase
MSRRIIPLLLLAGVLTYWNSLSGPFVLDDLLSVVHNQQIRELRSVNILFAERDSPFAGRPLANVSAAINYAIGGLDVRGYHVANIGLHLLSAVLLFVIVHHTLRLPRLRSNLTDGSLHIAGAAALIWTVHPLNSEVVNYTTQRTESLMAAFYLLTFYCCIRAAAPSRLRPAWELGAVLLCSAGMASKESMATVPLIVVAYDRTYLYDSWKEAWRNRRRLWFCLAATWLVLVLLLWSDPRGGSAGFESGVTPWTYLLNQTLMITRYLRLAICPQGLVVWYGWPLNLTIGEVLPQATVVVLLLLVTAVGVLRRPQLGFLGAWLFITLAPTSSVVPIATEVGAERRMYLPLMALAVFAVVGVALAWNRMSRQSTRHESRTQGKHAGFVGILALAIVAGSLAAATATRNREFASTLSLARAAVMRAPNGAVRRLLGTELLAAGDHEQGISLLRAAAPGAPMAHYDLGVALFEQDKLGEAIDELQALIDIWLSPPQTHAYWQPPTRSDVVAARLIMGQAFARQQRWPEAMEQYRLVLSMSASNRDARRFLADALFAQQAFVEAIPRYREYLALRPMDAAALNRLGIALIATQDLAAALPVFRRAVAVDAGNSDAHRNLATALLDVGDGSAAEHARHAVALQPENAALHELLGRALVLNGEIGEAAAQFERALRIDPSLQDARDALTRVRQLGAQTSEPAARR